MTNIQAAFSAAGNWYRGNVHTHSTASDGKRTPAEAAQFYRQNGYDFVALTDHLIYADVSGLNRDGFLVIPGIEIHGDDPASHTYHIVGLGGDMEPAQQLDELNSFAGDLSRLRSHGALAILAHPYWSGQLSRDLMANDGAIGVEVYNGVADVGYMKGFSNTHWDDLLAAGRRIWGLAVDDAHWLPWRNDSALGWLVAKASELTVPAVLEALRLGRFYASTGPSIHDFRVEGDDVIIASSPAMTIAAMGDRWLNNAARSATGMGITQARFKLWEGQTYVRAEIVDRDGKRAWSQPIFLMEPTL